jgi:hypothetical protein
MQFKIPHTAFSLVHELATWPRVEMSHDRILLKSHFQVCSSKYNRSIDQSINQSINQYLLTCTLNSKSAYYKASTKTQIQHKNSTHTQNKH